MDKTEVDGLIDFERQVIDGNKFVDADKIQFGLGRGSVFLHDLIIRSPRTVARTLSAVWGNGALICAFKTERIQIK